MKILITGAGGFVGKYLVTELLRRGHELVAIGINNGGFLKKMGIKTYEVDILNFDDVKDCLQLEQPGGVIHLAAQSNVQASWEKTNLTIAVNVNGTTNVFKAVASVCPQARLLNIGSSDEYGLTAKQGIPLIETMPCLPQNPYSISKLCAEQLVLQLGKKYGVNIVQVRAFNHFGPGQQRGFVVSDFCSQVAQIERKPDQRVLAVGNLDACRDFTFVEDVVRAYALLLESPGVHGVYNVCSGTARNVAEVLELIVAKANVTIDIVKDEARFRPSDVPFFVGSAAKLIKETGWQPATDFAEGIEKTLQWWREQK